MKRDMRPTFYEGVKLRPDSPKLDPDGPPPDTLSPDTLSPDTLAPDTTSWCGNGKLDPG